MECVTAQIRNPQTRAAYAAAVTRFFTWCDARGLALAQLSPIAVATYIDEMQRGYRAPTIKQHLAAIRRLFDWLVIGQVMPANPATSVRGPTHVVRTGKTPVLQPAEARLLLGVMVYSFARVSAVVGMRVEDYYQQGKRWWLRLQEKSGKHHAVPVHHKAEASLDAYLAAAEKDAPLWRSMPRAGGLSARRMSRVDVFRMSRARNQGSELVQVALIDRRVEPAPQTLSTQPVRVPEGPTSTELPKREAMAGLVFVSQ